MKTTDEHRRRFLAYFSGSGLAATLLPGVLWSQLKQAGAETVTLEMLKDALAISGLSFSDEDQKSMLQSVNQNLTRYEDIRNLHIPNDVSPPFHFTPITPGLNVNRIPDPLRSTTPPLNLPP